MVVEGVALPLVHACWITALVFTVLNAVLLTVRIRVENAALATAAECGRPMRDLVVAGGGPVGLATALYAARAGLDVVVREPRRGVVDKACGEGLMPGAVADLAALGVDPPGTRSPGSATSTAAARRTRRSGTAPGAGSAAPRCTGRCRRPWRTAGVQDRASARCGDGRATAATTCWSTASAPRYLVAADGLHSPVRRLLGLDAPREGRRRFGLAACTSRWRRGRRSSRCTGPRGRRPT